MTLYHPLGFHPIIIHHTAFFQFCTNFQYLAYTCLIHVWKTVLGSNTRTRLVCTKGDTRFLIKVGIETSARQVSTFGHTKWYKYWSFSKKISCQSGTGIGSFLKYSYQPGLGSTYEAGTRSRLVLPQVPTRQVLSKRLAFPQVVRASPVVLSMWPRLVIYIFCNPTHKTETGTANRWGANNSKSPGPIITMGQSEALIISQIIFITLFSAGATSHRKLFNYVEPKPFSWAKPAYFDFSLSNLLCRITYWEPLEMWSNSLIGSLTPVPPVCIHNTRVPA